MKTCIQVQTSSYGSWDTVGEYYVSCVPRVGEYLSCTGNMNIRRGAVYGQVVSVKYDLDSDDITVQIA